MTNMKTHEQIIPTNTEIDTRLHSFDGQPIGGLPRGRLTDLRVLPETNEEAVLVEMSSYALNNAIVDNVVWFYASSLNNSSVDEIRRMFNQQGVYEGVDVIHSCYFTGVLATPNAMLYELCPATDFIIVFGLELCYPDDPDGAARFVEDAVELSTKHDTTIIVCSPSWFSPTRGREYSVMGEMLMEYAALGLLLDKDNSIEFLYSTVGQWI